ncbi:MAG: hypothetical protein SXV54_10145 [Chloroflexota bacterium]|nr:hypothetical protein [Chloroflexota bacterium]
MKIGVLALQRAFTGHEKILARIGAEPVEVLLPKHLEDMDGLIIPGGESTTIGKVAQEWGLLKPIRAPLIERVEEGVEVLARLENAVVAARQGNFLTTAFHPELTEDDRFHRYFVSLSGVG